MNKKITDFLNKTKFTFSENSPAILTGLGIAGFITATVFAVKGTQKAERIMNDACVEANYDKEDLTLKDKAKLCWKCYIPTTALTIGSSICIIGANKVQNKRQTLLATAYELSTTALSEYKSKVIETIGENKEKRIQEEVHKESIKKHPVQEDTIIITGDGDTLCYDVFCKRYFKSSIDKLKKVENELNKRLLSEMEISLNEFYYEVGLDDVAVGDILGWNINNGLIEMNFSSQLNEKGEPCLVVGFNTVPKYDFRY